MAVHFIPGRAGAGKTHWCLRALQAELCRDEERRLIFIVPEQAALQMERALASVAPAGGYFRADVLGFEQLARRVAGESGPEPALIRSGARAMVLRQILADRLGPRPVEAANMRDEGSAAVARALADVFGGAAQTAGFHVELDRLIEDLLSENLSPGDLRAAAQRIPQPAARRKIDVIADTYAAYLDGLGEARLDAAARLALLRTRLANAPWLADATIWVDGFAGFTGQEIATLSALAAGARDVFITLLMDEEASPGEGSAGGLFARVATTYRSLRDRFEADGVQIGPPVQLGRGGMPRFSGAPELARLEREFAGEDGPDADGAVPGGRAVAAGPYRQPLLWDSCVRIVRAATHRDEVRLAARHIRQRVAEGGGRWRYRDFALIARDVEPLAETISDVFEEYEIPYFLDRRRPLRGLPVARLVEALLLAAARDLPPRAMSRLIRTGLAPLRRREAEAIERTVLRHGVCGARRWLLPVWRFDAGSARPGPLAASAAAARGEGRLNVDAARLRMARGLEPLLRLASGGAATARQWAAALVEVLERWKVRKRLGRWIAAAQAAGDREQTETHRLAWEACCELLEDMDACLGETVLDADRARDVVAGALAERTLGLAPPMLDQVLISSIERSRHPEVRHAWVLAFNEGVFPADPRDDAVLTRDERDALRAAGLACLASARDAVEDERLLAYIALTRPSEGLTISYAAVDDVGAAVPASPLLEDVRRALPHVTESDEWGDAPPLTLREAVRGRLAAERGASDGPAVARRRARYAALFERLARDGRVAPEAARLLRGMTYTNEARHVPAARGEGQEAAWSVSTSELKRYVECPFRHFAQHRLRLREPVRREPLARLLGNAAHQILAQAVSEAARSVAGAGGLTDAEWDDLLRVAHAAVRGAHDEDFERRLPREAFMEEGLREILRDVVAAHAGLYRLGGFEPLHVERAFDLDDGGALPALEWRGAGVRLRLRGRIDRVDAAGEDGRRWLVVTDYKASADALNPDVLARGELQLLAYAEAMRQLAAREGGAVVAGALFARLRADVGALRRAGLRNAAAADQAAHLFRVRGWLLREALVRYGAKPRGRAPIASLVREVTAAELEERLAAVRRIGLAAAVEYLRGVVAIEPLAEGRRLVCRECPFRPVCRFEPAFNRSRDARVVLGVRGACGGGVTTGGGAEAEP